MTIRNASNKHGHRGKSPVINYKSLTPGEHVETCHVSSLLVFYVDSVQNLFRHGGWAMLLDPDLQTLPSFMHKKMMKGALQCGKSFNRTY